LFPGLALAGAALAAAETVTLDASKTDGRFEGIGTLWLTSPKSSVSFFDRALRSTLPPANPHAPNGSIVVFEPSATSDEAQLREALAIAHVCKYSSEKFDFFSQAPGNHPLLEI